MKILRVMPSFDVIEFGLDDIVRSGLCKEYLCKTRIGLLMFNHVETDLPQLSERLLMESVTIMPDADELLETVSIISY